MIYTWGRTKLTCTSHIFRPILSMAQDMILEMVTGTKQNDRMDDYCRILALQCFIFTYLAVVVAAVVGAGTTLAGRGLTDLCIWLFLKSSTSGMCGRTPPWLIVTPFRSCRNGQKRCHFCRTVSPHKLHCTNSSLILHTHGSYHAPH